MAVSKGVEAGAALLSRSLSPRSARNLAAVPLYPRRTSPRGGNAAGATLARSAVPRLPTRLGRRGSAHEAHAADPARPRPKRTAWDGFDRRSVRDAPERARRLRSRARHATHAQRRAPARRGPRRDESPSGSRGQARAPGAPRRATGRPPRSPAAAPPPTHFRRLKLRPPPLTVRARTSSTHPAGTPPTDPLRALKNLQGLRVRSHRTDSCKTKPR